MPPVFTLCLAAPAVYCLCRFAFSGSHSTIIYYAAFSVWPPSLSIVHFQVVCTPLWLDSSFFILLSGGNRFFIRFPTEGQLGHFWVLVTMNKAAMNIYVQARFFFFFVDISVSIHWVSGEWDCWIAGQGCLVSSLPCFQTRCTDGFSPVSVFLGGNVHPWNVNPLGYSPWALLFFLPGRALREPPPLLPPLSLFSPSVQPTPRERGCNDCRVDPPPRWLPPPMLCGKSLCPTSWAQSRALP